MTRVRLLVRASALATGAQVLDEAAGGSGLVLGAVPHFPPALPTSLCPAICSDRQHFYSCRAGSLFIVGSV